jgi:hypothetical protein
MFLEAAEGWGLSQNEDGTAAFVPKLQVVVPEHLL